MPPAGAFWHASDVKALLALAQEPCLSRPGSEEAADYGLEAKHTRMHRQRPAEMQAAVLLLASFDSDLKLQVHL